MVLMSKGIKSEIVEPNWENLFESACSEVNAFLGGTTFHSMVIGMLQYGKRLHVAKPEDSTVETPRPSEILGSLRN